MSWAKKLEDNNDQVKILVKDFFLSITNAFSDLITEPIEDDFQLCRGADWFKKQVCSSQCFAKME